MQQTIVAQTIREQLSSSENKINGFNFFAYTGIKTMTHPENSLNMICPANPKKIVIVKVHYDEGQDLYNIITYKGYLLNKKNTISGICWDSLGEVIAREMGVL